MKFLRLYHIFVILVNEISSKPVEEHFDHWKGSNFPDGSKIYEYSNFGYGSISVFSISKRSAHFLTKGSTLSKPNLVGFGSVPSEGTPLFLSEILRNIGKNIYF